VGAVRVAGPAGAYQPPAGVDLISHVARWSGPLERTGRAAVLVRPGRAAGLRRWADETTPGPDGDRLTLRYADAEGLAASLVGYGADVRVLDPPEVREAVIQRLKEIAARHEAVAEAVG
jgi:proteasome accessory factor B